MAATSIEDHHRSPPLIGSPLPLYGMEYGIDTCRARHLASGITLDVADERTTDGSITHAARRRLCP